MPEQGPSLGWDAKKATFHSQKLGFLVRCPFSDLPCLLIISPVYLQQLMSLVHAIALLFPKSASN